MRRRTVCPRCGQVGRPRTVRRGNVVIGMFLWLYFLPAAIFYSAWRRSTRRAVCRRCFAPDIVLFATPEGRELARRFRASRARRSRPEARLGQPVPGTA